MIKELPPRRVGGLLVAMALVTGATVGFASGASAAGASSIEGKSCSFDEIGDQVFVIESNSVAPVVTHFTSFNVTAGTNSENSYRLNVVDRVSTTINGNSGGSETLFDQVTRTVGFGVRKDQATTDTEDVTVRWRFNNPGYYGLYKGTERVTGTYSRAVCDLDWGFSRPRYERRSRGTFSTFGPVEEGTVVCGDVLPAGTVRRAAQAMLRCGGTSIPSTGKAPAKAEPR